MAHLGGAAVPARALPGVGGQAVSHLRRPEQTTLLIIWGLSEVITVLIQRLEPPDAATPVLLRTWVLLKRYLELASGSPCPGGVP